MLAVEQRKLEDCKAKSMVAPEAKLSWQSPQQKGLRWWLSHDKNC